ncbi:ABC transporter permease [Actinomyces culturomici]|uniref:ABC transporter permease n=1 Tax=Actinomyces culturomici TaxID=1926276 RepID=UPI000E202272|nr:ABC transporter permease [Actinomyces culturomici]
MSRVSARRSSTAPAVGGPRPGPVRGALRATGATLRRVPGSVVVSVLVLAVLALWALAPALFAPGALDQDLGIGVTPAGTPGHLFGTDSLGRDVLALSIAGARSALAGPIVIAIGSMICGLVLGLTAAWFGTWWDALVSRTAEILLSLPVTLLAIVVAGILGGGYWATVGVLVLLFAPSDVRMIRAAALQQLPKPYLEATRVLGLATPRILVRHLLPNVLPIVWANLFVNVAFALVSLSGLSYLGFGVSAQAADWGRQLADGRDFLYQNPAGSVVPGVLIILAATAINIAGDYFAERAEERIGA